MIRKKQLADGTVRYLVRVGSSPSRTFTRKADAEDYETELLRSRRRGSAGLDPTKRDITYAQLVDLWRANFAPSQWREDMVAYSVERWGKARLSTIQPELLGAWIHSLTGQNGTLLSEKTRSHVLETMRQVLNAGVEWDYLRRSPARKGTFKAPRKNSRITAIRPFESWDEVVRVADACASRYAIAGPFVRFVCATGVRPPNEVVSLRWEDVLRNIHAIRVGSKSEAGHRTVPLSRRAYEALDELPRSLNGYVFTGKSGGQFDYANWRDTDWRDALEDCGLERRTPYEMRHTFATLALAEGASLDDVATVMGHKDINVTRRYYRKWIKASADRLRATLDQIGEASVDSTQHVRR